LPESDLHLKLKEDLRQAMRGGDKERVGVLRLVLAGVTNSEKECGAPTDDAGVTAVLAREVKRHKESIEAFKKGDRQDLVAKEEGELSILLEYLPKQMSRDEITETARRAIEEMGASGPRDKGKVMGRLMAELKGKAEGQEVNAVVSELLAAVSNE
jgi:uncharacterized protein YqeY